MADSEQRDAPAVSTPPEPQSVGRMLKTARVARDLSLEQVSTELRIEVQQLDALEQDRFERIGVPVFVKGYLRQYGARIGLDVPNLLLQYYKQTSLQEIQIQPSKTIRLRDERQITVWLIAALVLAVVVGALAIWWLNGGGFRIGAFTPASQTSTDRPAAAPAAAAAAAPSQNSSPIPTEVAPVAANAAGRPAANAQRFDTAAGADAEVASAAPQVAPAAAPAAAPRVVAPPPAAAPEESSAGGARVGSLTAALQVVFEQDSWAEISDARGERLFYGLGAAGRTAKLTGQPPFAVVLGNSAGVRITLDGEDFSVPTNGQPGDYSRFSVDVASD